MSYLDDLMRRMDSKEELPQSGPFKSSADTVSFQAYREAEQLQDETLLADIAERIGDATADAEILKLAFILSHLVRNTGSPRGAELYRALWAKASQDDQTLMYLIDGARKGKIGGCQEQVMRSLTIDGGLHLASAMQYLGEVVGREAIPVIGAVLDKDCYGQCDPFFCITALEDIGDRAALPYLQRYLQRHENSEGWEQEAVYYCKRAIEKLGSA